MVPTFTALPRPVPAARGFKFKLWLQAGGLPSPPPTHHPMCLLQYRPPQSCAETVLSVAGCSPPPGHLGVVQDAAELFLSLGNLSTH